jgi:hypothetical protein
MKLISFRDLTLFVGCGAAMIVLTACGGGGGSNESAVPGGGGNSGGGNPPAYTIGGAVSGLQGSVILQNNGGNNTSIAANGAFTFSSAMASGSAYAVTILTQPANQSCIVTAGSGTATANVSNVSVVCTTNVYTVSGTISGLARPIALQNNLGDDLTVSENGSFIFSKPVESGSRYSVSILNQAAAQTCAVSAGSGAVSSNVTDVTVDCSVDLTARFLPLIAAPLGNNPAGTTGLFAVASDSISHAPTWVAGGTVAMLGYSLPYTLDASGRAAGGWPFEFVYSTQGAAGGDHLYALDLSATSTLTPRQLTDLTLTSELYSQHCGASAVMKDLKDPSSTFFILGLPTDPYGCGGGTLSFRYVLVHITDSPQTTPIELPPNISRFEPLYRPTGELAGFLALDNSSNLNFYPDETFTHPTKLLDGVVTFGNVLPVHASPLSLLSNIPTYNFITVFRYGGEQALYRVDHTGAISNQLFVTRDSYYGYSIDADNLYFQFHEPADDSQSIGQVALDGASNGIVLHTYTVSERAGGSVSLVGPNGSKVIVIKGLLNDPVTGTRSSRLQALSVGAPGVPIDIASFDDWISARVYSGNLFVTKLVGTMVGGTYSQTSSTQIFALDGTVLKPVVEHSTFLPLYGPPTMLLKGVANASSEFGGGSLHALDLSAPSFPESAPLKRSDGGAITLPSGIQYAPSVTALSSTQGFGNGAGAAEAFALTYDLAKGFVAMISFKNTEVWVPREYY